MDEVEMQIGGTAVKFMKSPATVALRPTQGQMRQVELLASRFGAQPVSQTLGGFAVVSGMGHAQPMEDALNAIRAEPGVKVGSHVYHTSDDGVPFVPTGELFVRFKDGTKADDHQQLLDQYRLEVVRAHGARDLTVRITRDSPNPLKVAAALQKAPAVEVAEPDLATPGKLSGFVLPRDTLLKQQWHLQNNGELNGNPSGLKAGADARVLTAWKAAKSLGALNVVIAIIDDGFDLTHPDLSGSGKVVAPWDFTRNSNNPRPEFNPNYPYFIPEYDEWQGDWHGTACAGVAVGGANGSGILGAAPGCRLMPVRWGTDLSTPKVVAWFDYVRQQGAAVVSCSWGAAANVFPLSTQVTEAIARCASEGRDGKGCVICFAAGNEDGDIQAADGTKLNGFAIHPSVIAVAACTSRDERSHYSNYGDAIAVCAPSSGKGGYGIVTTDVMGSFSRNGQQYESGYSPGAFTQSFGGTSSATPLVAGICGLLLTIAPELTAAQVKSLIQETARKIGPATSYDANGHSRQFGYGCIDAAAAVKTLLAQRPPKP